MKLIHIADTHLGLSQFSRLDSESGMNLREKQVYENFLKAIDEIICQKPDALVHAGNLLRQIHSGFSSTGDSTGRSFRIIT